MQAAQLSSLGQWVQHDQPPAFSPAQVAALLPQIRRALHLLSRASDGAVGLGLDGAVLPAEATVGPTTTTHAVIGALPPLYPEWLGDRSFGEVHGVRFPYVVGAMANGIATVQMVQAAAEAGVLGFFGAAGLGLAAVEEGINELCTTLDPRGLSWGSNLIFMPNEPELEAAVADLYLRAGVRRVSASAYMRLTPAVVRLAASGLRRDENGVIIRKHYIFAKISRPEVARLFLNPPPTELLRSLAEQGLITADEAELAAQIPLCEDITVEADSGGHTDNRPLTVLLPVIKQQRDKAVADHGYTRPLRVGAAGGLGTPDALAAAFGAGADYVLTGTVNQAAVESGLSEEGRRMLATAQLADVTMAPSPDMFEMGVKVQVLKRGTLFAGRAGRLLELYNAHRSLDEIPAETRAQLEDEIFGAPLDEIWAETERFFAERNPAELARAKNDPRHRMALTFRWYVGRSSDWAIQGRAQRRLDYQIWCGPAMGAFNAWTEHSFLAQPEQRTVGQIARNLLEGAAVLTRAQQARCHGVPVLGEMLQWRPRPLS